MRVFIDSNILVSHLLFNHPHNERAAALLNKLLDEGATLVLAPQVIGEAYAISTSSKRVETPLSLEQFQSMALTFLTDPAVEFISPGIEAMRLAMEAGVRMNATSYKIFDLLLYGTMREHGITRLATFNTKHFADLPGIELVPIP